MLPNSLYELDGEAKKLDAQSHKLEVNNSVVSVQTVLCVHCTIYVTVSTKVDEEFSLVCSLLK